MKNKLIVFEGIDGVGKTTLSKMLVKALARRGIKSIRYEDLEKKDEGFNLLKPFVKKKASIDSSLFFYLASAIYKSKIIEGLLKKYWVICDRYIYSTLAYHRVNGAKIEFVPKLNELPIISPDFYFLIKVREKIRMTRASKRKRKSKNDLMPKRASNRVTRMEKELERFRPIVIDNSFGDIKVTIQKILDYI